MDEQAARSDARCKRAERTVAHVAETLEGANSLLAMMCESSGLSCQVQSELGVIRCALAWCVRELDELDEFVDGA